MASAFKAMDVVVACLSLEKGGGLEEGGLKIGPGGRGADFSRSDLDSAGIANPHFSGEIKSQVLDRNLDPFWVPFWVPFGLLLGGFWCAFEALWGAFCVWEGPKGTSGGT